MSAARLASGWRIARIFGIAIRLHFSWLVIFYLLTTALANDVLPLSNLSGGGSWRDAAKLLRSAARARSSAKYSMRDPQFPKSIWWHTDADFVGFRVVRPLRRPTAKEAARYGLDKLQREDLQDDLSRRELEP